MAKYEEFIGQTADKVLDGLGIKHYPYDAFEIAYKLDIPVSTRVDIENNAYSGFIQRHEDDSVSIWANPLDSKKQQNFTVAHEIGHLINGDLDNGRKEFRDNTSTLFRSIKSNEKEWKANEFAAELLMPRIQLKEVINEYFGDEKTATVGELAPIAEKFGVSKAAMVVRLKVLGVLK